MYWVESSSYTQDRTKNEALQYLYWSVKLWHKWHHHLRNNIDVLVQWQYSIYFLAHFGCIIELNCSPWLIDIHFRVAGMFLAKWDYSFLQTVQETHFLNKLMACPHNRAVLSGTAEWADLSLLSNRSRGFISWLAPHYFVRHTHAKLVYWNGF